MGVVNTRILMLAALLAALLAPACTKTSPGSAGSPAGTTTGASSTGSSSPKLTVAKVVTVTVDASGFHSSPATVASGTNVIWVAGDDGPHVVVSGAPGHEDGRFGPSPSMKKGASFTVVLSTPGTYRYFDKLHTALTGQIVVSTKSP